VPREGARPRSRSAILLLLAGAALTIIVSWSIAGFVKWPACTALVFQPRGREWPAPRTGSRSADAYGTTSRVGIRCWMAEGNAGPRDVGWVQGVETGWPLRAMAGEVLHESSSPQFKARSSGVMRRLASGEPTRWYPLRPLPLRFAADAAFFGALLWLVRITPRTIRAGLRRLTARSARCVHCNYDVSGLPPGSPCPECAAAPPAPPNR
jgi:hypothetical protein